jgi:gluconokinase
MGKEHFRKFQITAMIIIVMGVAGAGKTTIGSLLAHQLDWDFFDADDFHPESNRNKMAQNIPLTDKDRTVWLLALRDVINQNIQLDKSVVLACSALKESYRNILSVGKQVRFVYLQGTYAQIEARLNKRADHYMSVDMLASQFDTLEEPQDALTIDITQTPQEIIANICKGFDL